MSQPTHTHRTEGGKYAELQQHIGAGPLAGQQLVIYTNIEKGFESVTTHDDWLDNWRPLLVDDCPICLGTGHDHIKGNRERPCGHCYGLGKMRADGEAATDQWELATVATGIIERQKTELEQLRALALRPDVQELLIHERQKIVDNSAALEQQWRDGQGHGPGGQRYTGD